MKNVNRRAFLVGMGGMSIVVALSACGGSNHSPSPSGDSGGQGGNDECGDGTSALYANPGHAHTTIGLTAQELSNAQPGVYTLMGGSHDHTFNLTAQDFADIINGGAVLKNDLEGHGHLLQLKC